MAALPGRFCFTEGLLSLGVESARLQPEALGLLRLPVPRVPAALPPGLVHGAAGGHPPPPRVHGGPGRAARGPDPLAGLHLQGESPPGLGAQSVDRSVRESPKQVLGIHILICALLTRIHGGSAF